MKVKAVKDVGNVSKSSDYTKKKKHDRAGLDGKAKQGFDYPSGNPSNSLDYKTPVGDTYERAIAEGMAHTDAVKKPGASNDVSASVDAKRAKRLQANPEKVRDAVPQPAGYATRLAQANDVNNNPKKRTSNSWGIETLDE